MVLYLYSTATNFVSFAVVFLDFTFQDAWIICDELFGDTVSKNEGKILGWWMVLLGKASSAEVENREK